MDLVGHGLDQHPQEGGCGQLGSLAIDTSEHELGGPIDPYVQEAFAAFITQFGDVDVEVADLVLLELLGFSRSAFGRREMPWRWRQRCRLDRVRCGTTSLSATKTSSSGKRAWTCNATIAASSIGDSTVLRGSFGPIGQS